MVCFVGLYWLPVIHSCSITNNRFIDFCDCVRQMREFLKSINILPLIEELERDKEYHVRRFNEFLEEKRATDDVVKRHKFSKRMARHDHKIKVCKLLIDILTKCERTKKNDRA